MLISATLGISAQSLSPKIACPSSDKIFQQPCFTGKLCSVTIFAIGHFFQDGIRTKRKAGYLYYWTLNVALGTLGGHVSSCKLDNQRKWVYREGRRMKETSNEKQMNVQGKLLLVPFLKTTCMSALAVLPVHIFNIPLPLKIKLVLVDSCYMQSRTLI